MSEPLSSSRPTPLTLGWLFVQVALSGIGGGLPAHMRTRLRARGWLSDQEYAESYTLASLTPGPNAVNLAAVIGAHLCGRAGACAAVLGVLSPGILAMLLVSAVTLRSPHGLPPQMQSALHGAACAAVAIMLSSAIPVVQVSSGVKGGLMLSLLTFVALGLLKLELLPVLLCVVGAGLYLHRTLLRRTP